MGMASGRQGFAACSACRGCSDYDGDERTMKKEKFVNLLARRGLSIVTLADKSGVSRPTLYKYVHGKGKPRLDTAAKLARVLDVPPSAIMFD